MLPLNPFFFEEEEAAAVAAAASAVVVAPEVLTEVSASATGLLLFFGFAADTLPVFGAIPVVWMAMKVFTPAVD